MPAASFHLVWHNEVTGNGGRIGTRHDTRDGAERHAAIETRGKRRTYVMYVRDAQERDVAQYREGAKVETITAPTGLRS